MARGFDSKSVEEQQAAFAAKKPSERAPAARYSLEEAARNRERELLMLSRKQVAGQLAATTSPRHRQMLEESLAELDGRLEKV